MPISSYHRLTSNSTCKPWNTTRSPRHPRRTQSVRSTIDEELFGDTRHRSWTFHAGETVPCASLSNTRDHEGNKGIEVRPKSATDTNECVSNKQSVRKCVRRSQSASTLGRTASTRSDPHTEFRGSERDGSARVARSHTKIKNDASVRSKVSKWKQVKSQQPKKATCSAKRKDRSDSTMKLKGRHSKVHSSSPTLFPSSPTNAFTSGDKLQDPDIGERVACVLNKRIRLGVLKYCGRTHFAEGQWCGIVLDKPCGKNDGSVRGVRYFQCKSGHGIFVHSHKVGTVDDYWDWFCSQDYNWENERLAPTRILTENLNWSNRDMSCVEKQSKATSLSKNSHEHRARHSLCKIEKRTRSRSLDRCLLVKVKLPRQSGLKCGGLNPSALLVRSVSLPKIEGNHSLVSVKNTVDNKDRVLQQGIHSNGGESTSDKLPLLGAQDLNNTCTDKLLSDSEELDVMQSSENPVANHDHTIIGHKKLGHTMSLDTHLRMEQGCGDTASSGNSWHPGCNGETTLAHSKTVDAFLEGQYSSCPSLVPSSTSNVSNAIATCLDLGRPSNRETHIQENGLDQKIGNDGERLPGRKPDSKLKLKGRSASHSKLICPSSPVVDLPSGKNLDKRSSWPSLLHESAQNNLLPSGSATCLPMQCPTLDPSDGDLDLSVKANETASDSYSHMSGSEASLSSTGVCSTEESKTAVKNFVSKPASIEHPSRLKRPEGFKTKPSHLAKMSQSKNMTSPSGENVSRLETRTVKLPLDSRLQKRHTLSDVKSPYAESSTQSIPEHAAVDGSSNSLEVKERNKMSKLPLLRKSSSPQIQSASNERVPVFRRGSGLQAPSVKMVKPKTSVPASSRNVSQGVVKADPASSSKPITRNMQAPKGSAAMPQNSTKSATRRASAPSSKVARTPASAPGIVKRISTTSVPEEKKVSTTSRPGIKQPSKPTTAAVGQSTSKQSSRLPKLPARKPSGKSSTPEPCTGDNAVPEHSANRAKPTGQTSANYAPRRNSRQQGVTVCGKDIGVSSNHVMSQAPDILSQTLEVSKQSVGIQVEDEERKKTVEDLQSKALHLEELLRHKKFHCSSLEESLKEISADCVAAAIVVNAFGGKMKVCGRHILLLQKKADTLLEELKHTQRRLADEEANGIKLQEEMMYTASEHKVALETLKADHERMLEELRETLNLKYAEEMEQVVKTHSSQLDEEKAQHAKDIESLKRRNEESIAVLMEEHKDEISELENKQSQAIEEIMEEHQVEVETIKSDYEDQEMKLKNKMEDLGGECRSLSQKLKKTQEEAQRDIESRIQDAIKSYESLPAELESMKAVLEIKNEDIKVLRQQKMEIKMELERLQKIQDRIQKLEQENESLSFVVETKSAFQRQLSVERDNLRNSLERESKKANRLSLEKEELQWRLYNSPSPPLPEDSSGVGSPKPYRLSCSFPDVTSVEE